jgi:hypothetical protein
VSVRDGIVGFDPVLLRRQEFLAEPGAYRYFDLSGAPRSLDVAAGSLAFTYCQVPVVYTLTGGEAWVRVTADDEATVETADGWLTPADSHALIGRRGGIARIEVGVPERSLFEG